MTDVCVTVPKWFWEDWVEEGQLPDEAESGQDWHFYLGGARPKIEPGERVYIVAHNRLRGYAPLTRIDEEWPNSPRFALVRNGGAVALTIDEPIRGFRGWRYRSWRRDQERPFPDWMTP